MLNLFPFRLIATLPNRSDMTASPYTNLSAGTSPSQKQGIGATTRLSSPSPAAGPSTTAGGATQPTADTTAAAVAVVAAAAAAAAAAMTAEEMKEMSSAEETRSSSQSALVSDPAYSQSRCVFAKDSTSSIARRSTLGRSFTLPPKAQRPTLERRQSLSAPTSRAASPVRGDLEINKRTIARRKQQQQESMMIVRSSAPPPPTPPPTRSQSPFTTKSLVVDDNNITGEILSRILQKDFGHSVTCVVSGEDALEKLASDVFNMCFLDIDMPGINGIETTLVIRRKVSLINDVSDAEDTDDANEDDDSNEESNEGDRDKSIRMVQAASAHVLDENRDIPIIAYTTNTCVEQYLEAGMNGFITKPPSRRSLKNELDRIL